MFHFHHLPKLYIGFNSNSLYDSFIVFIFLKLKYMYIKHQMIKTVQSVLTCTNAHEVTMIVTCVDLVKRRLTFCHMNKQQTRVTTSGAIFYFS